MLVHRDIDHLPVFKNAVITIGTFDGVHTGHQQIIAQLKQEAAAVDGETVLITFHPHPRKVVSSKNIHILTTLPEKTELLEALGVDHLVVVPFNETFAHQTAEEYVTQFLYRRFRPHTIIIGYDHRFGRNRQGDYHLLEDYGRKLGFRVKEIPEHLSHQVIVSSTKIREALLSSDVTTANEYLGYHYFFEGVVVQGNRLGRQLGYPTANLEVKGAEKLVPGNGIYAVTVVVSTSGAMKRPGMMSIGIRPTIGDGNRTIEVNIFDFSEEIYGQTVRVYMRRYLRPEAKFESLDALKEQLAKDKIDTLATLRD